MATSKLTANNSDPSIALQVKICFSSFDSLACDLLQSELYQQEGIGTSKLSEELGRFRVWAGNVGAHRQGRCSLDYRLRDASHIKAKVISLLRDLNGLLHEGEFFAHMCDSWG